VSTPAQAATDAETAGKTGKGNAIHAAPGSRKPGRNPEDRSRKTKEEKRRDAEERNRISRATSALKHDLTETEERISVLEAKQRENDLALCEPEIYKEPDRIKQLNQEIKTTAAELEDLYYAWNDLTLRIEALDESLRG
jgi:uncharacterized protein (DUF849 family)